MRPRHKEFGFKLGIKRLPKIGYYNLSQIPQLQVGHKTTFEAFE